MDTNSNRHADDGLTLRDVAVERSGVRWQFELRRSEQAPVLLTVRSSRTGLVHDVQQLGAIHAAIELPSGAVELISTRIREELVRAKLAVALGDRRERWAA